MFNETFLIIDGSLTNEKKAPEQLFYPRLIEDNYIKPSSFFAHSLLRTAT